MSDGNDRLERQMEGTNLALAAVAEVLQKMDDRLNKAEEQEFYMDQAQQERYDMQNAYEEKTQLVKAIAGEVLQVMKAGVGESKQGMEVDGSGSKKAKASSGSGGTVTGGGNDDSKGANPDTNTKTVGQAIEAMQKQLQLIKAGYGMAKENGEEENGEEEEETEEERRQREAREAEGEGSQDYPEMNLAMENLQKQMNDFQKNMGQQITNESEKRLAKMGFKEETSLQSPTLIRYDDDYGNPLGIDGTTPVTKSNDVDVVDQLSDMSYKQLRDLQFKIESGDTDGVPRELLG
jgi:hypothetical protein